MNLKTIVGYFLVGLLGGIGYELFIYSTSDSQVIDWVTVIVRVAVISICMALAIAFFRTISKKGLNS